MITRVNPQLENKKKFKLKLKLKLKFCVTIGENSWLFSEKP
jgi:hypothetical protein